MSFFDASADLDARAAALGLSRVEHVRRQLAKDARVGQVRVSTEDLIRLGDAVADLANEDVMRDAWQ